MTLTDGQFLRATLLIFFGCVLLDAVLAGRLSPTLGPLVIGIIGAAFMVPLLAVRLRQLGFSRAWGLAGLLLPFGFTLALGLYFFGYELERFARTSRD